MAKKSPTIVLPRARVRVLRKKLAEYRGRLDYSRAPELQMDTICKMTVLGWLLRDGQVDTWELSRQMATTSGSGFDPWAFTNACGVIEDYCKTGGQNVSGGSLPTV